MDRLVTYEEHESGYGVISLNREEKRNAISLDMAAQLKAKIQQAERRNLKFLILTNPERTMFSAGGDLKDLHGELTCVEAYERLYPMQEVLQMLLDFPVPVIAKLNGDALGGGCELATACDIRVAKEDTKFGFIQTNIGILPGWGGGALLYKKVNPSFALDWITSGELLSAQELREEGWIQHLNAEEKLKGKDTFSSYLRKSREQMHLLKSQFQKNLNVDQLKKEMEAESKASASLWESDAHKSALANFSRRKK